MVSGGAAVSWRFYPLAECISEGVLVGDGRGGPKPRVAELLTLEEAKRRVGAKKIRKASAA
jgi:hypothetical protein